jgi:ATP-binding cassette subfamily C protein EexD
MLTPTLYMLQLYDRVVVSRSEETLLMFTIILLAIFVFLFIFDWTRNKILIRLANIFNNGLNKNIFESLFSWSLKEPTKANVSPVRDLNQIRQFINSQGIIAIYDFPWIFIYLACLYYIHPYYGHISLFSLVVLSILIYLNELLTKEKQEQASGINSDILESSSSYLNNSEVVHSMGMQDSLYTRYNNNFNNFIQLQTNVSDLSTTLSLVTRYLRILFQSLILGIGAYLVINMELTPGMMIAGSFLLGRMLAPLDILVSQWKNIVLSRQSYSRLNKLLNDTGNYIANKTKLPEPMGIIELKGLYIKPPGGIKPIIKNVSYKFENSNIYSIIGESASGKSSLLRAIMGVWPISSGKVTLDGADIAQWDQKEFGSIFGYLPQDIELFDGTVAQNIARMDQIDDEKVIEAAKKCGLHEIIVNFPNGYDTQIGPRGTTLSGGQRQRIGLARAIYGNPKVIILDEPNSNLDDNGEKALVNTLLFLKSTGMTIIMVTHKLNIIRYTDNVLVIKDGTINSSLTSKEFLEHLEKVKRS